MSKCELKFRVWWPSVKKMRYFDNARIDYADGTYGIFIPCVNENVFIGEGESMQYMMIRDKNGKEVYASDIIKADWGFSPVDIIEYPHSFYILKEYLCVTEFCGEIVEHIEVVGNIYENPDLVEEIG